MSVAVSTTHTERRRRDRAGVPAARSAQRGGPRPSDQRGGPRPAQVTRGTVPGTVRGPVRGPVKGASPAQVTSLRNRRCDRRVRHEVRDGLAVIGVSALASVGLALALTALLALAARAGA